MKNCTRNKSMVSLFMVTCAAIIFFGSGFPAQVIAKESSNTKNSGRWMSGDFHQHTTYTDGANPIATVMEKNNEFGLDWWANSEHGGGFSRDGYGPVLQSGFDTGEYARYWDDTSSYPAGTIIGDSSMSGSHQNMWRWQSIRDYSFQDILAARIAYADKTIVQGLEWNVPGHEHCSTAIIDNQFNDNPDTAAMAEFEYKFDNSDKDKTGGAAQGWLKSALTGHAKAVEAAAWMQANHRLTSWMVPAHPERKALYTVQAFRDLNNAAPDVAFGFESIPGHQKESDRGSYGTGAVGKGTYGGVGIYSAKIGGLWDAMLGEGRHWWLFASSDFHAIDGDFWPGEYTKTWTYIVDEDGNGNYSPQEIVDALRSGNSFIVHGDLINALDFHGQYKNYFASMGQELVMDKGGQLKITIRFKNPAVNNYGDPVVVDHIQLISGEVKGNIAPSDPAYANDTNDTSKIEATFTADDWDAEEDGWYTIVYHIKDVKKNMYFRIRGTNLEPNTPCETDMDGNPLLDRADTILNPGCENHFSSLDGAEEAWSDLWFYSNPIFVKVQ
jgi:hypothetical protein